MNRVIFLLIAAMCGALFAAGLVVSDMINPLKILGFLDITGDWNPRLALVIIGALAVFIPIYHGVIKSQSHSVLGEPLTCHTQGRLEWKLWLGSAVFGIGWGLIGLCPGPALTLALSLEPSIVVFIVSMAFGMGLSSKVESLLTSSSCS
ncbi:MULTISPECIES: DUF6691 family protein [unclassified Vibrio]|uniref:DUF6691 family protein n=1 Tax=Vibrio sp. HB236076 TaxID=3232307 RepID=A0AB39HJ87_9VIBR|nr:DUF6691 family protein [Vibrio sp. HB161653]MDP5252962.1 YeeE/YedE family protein [Vibrio sp. HB161653]